MMNKLTDYWKGHEITKEDEYAILTNIIHQEWTGVSVKKHKDMKGLKTQNLRDHMSEAELIFTALAHHLQAVFRRLLEGFDIFLLKHHASCHVCFASLRQVVSPAFLASFCKTVGVSGKSQFLMCSCT